MPSSETHRSLSLLCAVFSMIFILISVGGNWCTTTDYSTPVSQEGFNGKSVFTLWQFCADGDITGLPITEINNTQVYGKASLYGCITYGTTYYVQTPVCDMYTGRCYYTYKPVVKLPGPTPNLATTRVFVIIACVCAILVPCGSYYGHQYEYEESHGQGVSCLSVTVVLSGIIATITFCLFTSEDTYWFYSKPLQEYKDFDYIWGFICFVIGWCLEVFAAGFQLLGIRKEEKEEQQADFNEAMGLKGEGGAAAV